MTVDLLHELHEELILAHPRELLAILVGASTTTVLLPLALPCTDIVTESYFQVDSERSRDNSLSRNTRIDV